MRLGGGSRARVEVGNGEIRVVPVGSAKVWALRRHVRVPTAMIRSVGVYTEEPDEPRLGVKTGIYRSPGVRAFLVVGDARPVVVVECPGATFDRVVFSADDPASVVTTIERVLSSHLP